MFAKGPLPYWSVTVEMHGSTVVSNANRRRRGRLTPFSKHHAVLMSEGQPLSTGSTYTSVAANIFLSTALTNCPHLNPVPSAGISQPAILCSAPNHVW